MFSLLFTFLAKTFALESRLSKVRLFTWPLFVPNLERGKYLDWLACQPIQIFHPFQIWIQVWTAIMDSKSQAWEGCEGRVGGARYTIPALWYTTYLQYVNTKCDPPFAFWTDTDTQNHPQICATRNHKKIRIIDHKLVTILSSSSMCEAVLSNRSYFF
jgi:hypothetical protein